jgi:hypothetical protein
LALVNQRGVLKVAQENLKRQQQIADANITQATTEVAVAQEQDDGDRNTKLTDFHKLQMYYRTSLTFLSSSNFRSNLSQ